VGDKRIVSLSDLLLALNSARNSTVVRLRLVRGGVPLVLTYLIR
jgi:hypothetical protein